MRERIEKATARRDFFAGLALDDENFLPQFVRAEHELSIAMASIDKVAAARALVQRKAA